MFDFAPQLSANRPLTGSFLPFAAAMIALEFVTFYLSAQDTIHGPRETMATAGIAIGVRSQERCGTYGKPHCDRLGEWHRMWNDLRKATSARQIVSACSGGAEPQHLLFSKFSHTRRQTNDSQSTSGKIPHRIGDTDAYSSQTCSRG